VYCKSSGQIHGRTVLTVNEVAIRGQQACEKAEGEGGRGHMSPEKFCFD